MNSQILTDIRRAQEAGQRYFHSGKPAALDEAVAIWEQVLAHPAFATAEERLQLAALNDAGGIFLRRYQAQGRLEDLDQALGLLREAVQRAPPDSPNLPFILNNLGSGLSERYDHTGRMKDLEEEIRLFREAAQRMREVMPRMLPLYSPHLPSILSNLGTGLSIRHARTGQLKDLEEAVRVREEALSLTSRGWPERPALLNNLGNVLLDRYRHIGHLQDLERAVSVYQEAIDLTSPDLPDLPAFLSNLGLALLRLADADPDQRQAYLSCAGARFQRATSLLDAIEADHLLRARTRYHLGRCYHQLGRWREAITLLEQARETFSRHKARPELAHALLELGQLYHLIHDFESANIYLKDALRLFRRLKDTDGIAVTQEALGSLSLLTGRPSAAIDSFRKARWGYIDLQRNQRVREIDNLLQIAHRAIQPMGGAIS